jgi:hypothetical protein
MDQLPCLASLVRSASVAQIVWFLGVHGNELRLRRVPLAIEAMGWLPRGAGARCFAFVKAHLCRRCQSHLIPAPLTAMARGFGIDLDQLPRRLVSDHGSVVLGIASVRMKLPRL